MPGIHSHIMLVVPTISTIRTRGTLGLGLRMQGPESVVAAKSVIRGLSVGEPLAAVVEESADVEAGSTAGCVENGGIGGVGVGDVGALALQVLGGAEPAPAVEEVRCLHFSPVFVARL